MIPVGFQPMLASPAKTIKFPVIASPKIDGIRAHAFEKMYSRKLKPLPNKHLQKIMECVLNSGLDGEVLVGPPNSHQAYRRTSSAVMSIEGAPEELIYYVFDKYIPGMPFIKRFYEADRLVRGLPKGAPVRVLEHITIENEEDLRAYEEKCLAEGYEGIMTRDPNGPYKCGRSTPKEEYLLKVKRFCDGEAEILQCLELNHNMNEATINELGRTKRSSHKAGRVAGGVLGALRVSDVKSGVVFQIGSGFTDEEKSELWSRKDSLVGAIAKYRYFPTGNKDKPRFPVFLGFRDPID